jgi:tetratricopeptide (TPR) repeat protein
MTIQVERNMHITQSVFTRILLAVLIAVTAGGCSRETDKSSLLVRAHNYFEAGKYDDARIEYSNLLRMDRQNATAIQQLGIIWFEEGAPLQALPFLLKARELDPNNLNGGTKLAMALMAVGEVSNARKEALAILGQDPSNDDAIILLADTAQTPQEIEGTEQRLQTLFAECDKASLRLASASLSTRKGDMTAAEDAVRHALALDGKLPLAHLAMADLLLLRGEPVQAAQEFKTAAELAPIRSTARLKYAEFERNAGAQAEATAMLKEITRQAPDYLPAWGCLAKIAYKEKRYDESLALLEYIFNRDPLNLEGRLFQSDVLLAKGDVKLALDRLDRLNEAYPDAPAIKYQLARAYLQNDSPTQAIVALNQALASNPDYIDATLLLGEADIRAGDAQRAVVSMQSLLEKHPNVMQAKVVLAAAYRSLGQLDDAAATFRKQINVSPQNAQAYVGLGLILREQGKMTEARKAFEKAQELDPQNPAAVQQLVELDILSKDFTSAFLRVQRQFKKSPGSADADFLEAKIYVAQGEWDRAEAALLKTLELDPNYSGAYDLLIYTYIAANKLTDATSHLNSLISKQPDDVRLLMLSGLIYEKMNQFSHARDAYEKLLSVCPDFSPALNNLACLYSERLNQLDRAYALARKARALEPGAAATADTLGWILYKRADYDQALTLLKESAMKLPDTPEIQFHLGMAYYMMGQTEAARAALVKVAGAQSEFPDKQDAQRRLALLGGGSGVLATPSIDELETILKQQPDDIVAGLLLGDAYERQGEFGSAAAAYAQTVRFNRKLLPAFVRLAKLYAGPLDNREKAVEFAEKVRELTPNDPQSASEAGKL